MTQEDIIWEETLPGGLVNEQLSGQIMKDLKYNALSL